jgi:UDP:flavonoid glycosyltransferase YjiC (YdhE family)
MRVLITTTGSAGHLGPLIPFADAIRDAGGDILMATRESTAAQVRAAGYDVRSFGEAPDDQRGPIFAAARGLSSDEANALVVAEVFAGMDARAALPGVLGICADWRPDVVLSEVSEFAGGLAAAHLDLPAVGVAITQASVEQRVIEPTTAALHKVRTDLGLNAPNGAGSAYFTLFPAVMEDPVLPGPAHVKRFREHDGPAPEPLPDWWDGAGEPLVYLTFGSVAPQMDFFPGVYRAAIDALAGLPIRLLVTIGRDRDPAELGAVPANVHVERWVPQRDVMPHAAVMVSHGGSGTVRAGLAASVPLVVLPLFADQPYNAARVDALGAGIALAEGPAGIAGMADAVRAVLADHRYARQAAAVAAEIRTLPTVDVAAGIVRELAAR